MVEKNSERNSNKIFVAIFGFFSAIRRFDDQIVFLRDGEPTFQISTALFSETDLAPRHQIGK